MASSLSPARPRAALHHQRRLSGRRPSTSSVPTSPNVETPRTLCPRDTDAFSYDPNHLPAWYIPQDLWNRLPQNVQSALAAVQHCGASVLTGYERLESHRSSKEDRKAGPDQVTLADIRSHSFSSSAVASSCGSPTSSTTSSPALTGLASPGPVSPISLTPPDLTQPHKRHHERSFSVPMEPHDAYYAAELSYLRTESLPRLRHAARKVDTEWYDAKRLGAVPGSDAGGFEQWWAQKKVWIQQLSEQGRRLSLAMGMSSTGMGWTAP